MKRSQGEKIGGAVLVADDHEITRFGMVLLVRRSLGPSQVLQATCFKEVLSALDTAELKLVVCDLVMPGLTSPSQLALIRQRRPEVKLVVLSGMDDRASVLGALEAGVHGYLLKTASSEDNLDHIRHVLAGEIYVPPLVAMLSSPPAEQIAPAPDVVPDLEPEMDLDVRLSPRQVQVLEGLVRGLSNKEIGRELELAEGTIKMHVGAVLRALNAGNRARAAAIGQRLLRPR